MKLARQVYAKEKAYKQKLKATSDEDDATSDSSEVSPNTGVEDAMNESADESDRDSERTKSRKATRREATLIAAPTHATTHDEDEDEVDYNEDDWGYDQPDIPQSDHQSVPKHVTNTKSSASKPDKDTQKSSVIVTL